MNKVNENETSNIKIIKHYIKDLSFENPQTVNENNSLNNNNNNLTVNMDCIFENYEKNFFSVIMKYSCECSSKKSNKNLFVFELDYLGFFKVNNKKNYDQTKLTKEGVKLLLPFVQSIILDITNKGGSIPISLENVDFSLINN